MEKLKLKLEHVQPYLEHRVKVQYEGIINGAELKEYCKRFNDGVDESIYDSKYISKDFNPPKAIKGLKIGYIKSVGYYKNHEVYNIGTKYYGLKSFYSWNPDFKLLLRPLSDLIKPIEVNGKTFILAQVIWSVDVKEEEEFDLYGTIPDYWKNCMKLDFKNHFPYRDMKLLFKYHFDIFGLIDKKLAIDINTI